MANAQKHIVITPSETLKESIVSRAAIVNLFDFDISNIKTVKLNFKHISFVSRSAVHQLIVEKRRLEKKKIKIIFSSMSKEVKAMFNAVSESQQKPKQTAVPVHILNFSTQKELQNFLLRV